MVGKIIREQAGTENMEKVDFEKRLAKSLPIKSSIRHVKVNSYDINYLVAGRGTPLILIHGLNIGWGQWYPNISVLSKHFKIYAIDLPGAGASTPVNYRSVDLERDYLATAREFISHNRLFGANIVGHSFGGWIALRLASESEVKIGKIVAVSPLGLTDHVPWKFWPVTMGWSTGILASFLKPTTNNLDKITNMLAVHAQAENNFSNYYRESLIKKGGASHPFFFINRLCDPLHMKKEVGLKDKLQQISRPTMFILGDRDPLLLLRKISPTAESLPLATIRIFRDTGHLAPLEQSLKFNKAVINFLS